MIAIKCIALSVILLMVTSSLQAKERAGDVFRQTAAEHNLLAKMYKKEGREGLAELYKRMAQIKSDAARFADRGRWDFIDWLEYEEIERKVQWLKFGDEEDD